MQRQLSGDFWRLRLKMVVYACISRSLEAEEKFLITVENFICWLNFLRYFTGSTFWYRICQRVWHPTPTRRPVSNIDLTHLMHSISPFVDLARRWHFISNADADQWFGGSRSLQYTCWRSVTIDLLISIRRMTDKGRPNENENESVVATLRQCGMVEEADALFTMPEIQHIRTIATYTIAHGLTEKLLRKDPQVDVDDPGKFRPVDVYRAVHAILKAAEQCGNFRIGGTTIGTLDPLRKVLKQEGVPMIDFPIDVYS